MAEGNENYRENKYRNKLPIYDKRKCAFFALGRNAIYAVCKILNLEKGDEVLTPAFDCDGALQPFNVLGLKLTFFKSDYSTFKVNIDDIKSKITPKTKLIHIINHFGFPQPWDELLQLRKDTEIPILEDNAYSLFSKYNSKMFGEFGDFAIFSLHKNLPLINGGLLKINNNKYSFNFKNKKSKWFYAVRKREFLTIIKIAIGYYKIPEKIKKKLRRFNSYLELPPPLYSERLKGVPKVINRDVIGSEFSCDYLRPMSKIAKIQLRNFLNKYYEEVITKKQEYYLKLSNSFSKIKNIEVLYPNLPKGAVPFSFSFLVKVKRDEFFNILRKKYDLMAWPTLPQLVLDQIDNFPEVELLGRQLLQFNLAADKVILPEFSKYMTDFIHKVTELSKKYL